MEWTTAKTLGVQTYHTKINKRRELYGMIVLYAVLIIVIGQCIYQYRMNKTLFLIKRRVIIMAETIASLTQKVADLKIASDARELRDVAQDAVTTAQIATLQSSITALQATIDALNASGGMSAENQALLDGAVVSINSVIDSLNAADPTPPVV
jgi:hypothetical protein